MPDYKNILYEKRGHIAYVTINRPDRRNAIDPATSHELKAAFEAFKADDAAWVAILTGAGDQAFSAGADLLAMSQALSGGGEGVPMNVPFGGITRGYECWKPIIAAINGYCLAGGLEIALSCDVRVAAEHAQFGLPEPRRAIIPAAGGTQRLPRSVPLAFAMELLLTGDRFDAQTALRFGLVSRVVPQAELMATADQRNEPATFHETPKPVEETETDLAKPNSCERVDGSTARLDLHSLCDLVTLIELLAARSCGGLAK